MLNGLFFAALIGYFAATVLELGGMVFKKEKITRIAWWLFLAGALCNTAYLAARGIVAGRLPLSNQFEFATAFAWGIAILLIGLQVKAKAEQQTKLKELEQRKVEAENSEIVDIVRGMSIPLAELPLVLQQLRAGKTLGQNVPKSEEVSE